MTSPADQLEALAPHSDSGEGGGIPRIIHQVFVGGELPPLLADNIAMLRRANPQWDHRLYDDEAAEGFIAAEFGDQVLAAYRSINPRYGAARADLLRYLLVYKKGGLYLDVKSKAERPLDECFAPGDAFLISQWRAGWGDPHFGWGRHWELRHIAGGEFQQWFIAAAPGHPFLKAAIERVLGNLARYNPLVHGVGRRAVLRTTGPIAYTLAIEPLLAEHPHRRVAHEACLGLRDSFLPGTSHRQLLPGHYETERQPLVGAPLHRPQALLLRALEAGRDVRDRVRNRLLLVRS